MTYLSQDSVAGLAKSVFYPLQHNLYRGNSMFKIIMTSLLAFNLLFLSLATQATESAVYKQSVSAAMDKVYPEVYEKLEEARFFVVFEANIGKNLKRFAERWGDNHNRNKLDSIRSMVFCNAWYANAVSNADPDMLALCPLRLSLYEKQGVTSVVFARPAFAAQQSKARPVLLEAEQDIIKAINNALSSFPAVKQ